MYVTVLEPTITPIKIPLKRRASTPLRNHTRLERDCVSTQAQIYNPMDKTDIKSKKHQHWLMREHDKWSQKISPN